MSRRDAEEAWAQVQAAPESTPASRVLRASAAQLGAIKSFGRALGLSDAEQDAAIRARFLGRRAGELTRREAGEVIDEWRARGRGRVKQ